jgi:hypothetical protein
MKTAKCFERYYKMALCKEVKLYHNQMQSSESTKHEALYEVKLSLIISLKPELCPSDTPNSQ